MHTRPRDANAIRQAYTAPSQTLPSSLSSSSPSLLSSARRPSFNPSTPDLPPSHYSLHRPLSTSPILNDQDVSFNSSFTRSSTPPAFSSSLLQSQRPSSSIPLSQSQLGLPPDYPSSRPSRPATTRLSSSHLPLSDSQPLASTHSYPSPSPSSSQSSIQPTNSSSMTKNAKDNKAPASSFSSSILASRYSALRPPSSIVDSNSAFSKQAAIPPSYPRPIFDTQAYFVGVWKRAKWDNLGDPPLALNGSGGFLHLDTYDTDDGPAFKWIPFHDAQHPTDWYYLECEDCKLNYVTPKLRMTDSIDHAAIWRLEGFRAFRGEKGDVSIKIFSEDGMILCSSIQEKSVALLTEEQADMRDEAGSYLYNDAWECSPELSDPEASSWLEEYLGDDFEDSEHAPDLPSFLFEKPEFT